MKVFILLGLVASQTDNVSPNHGLHQRSEIPAQGLKTVNIHDPFVHTDVTKLGQLVTVDLDMINSPLTGCEGGVCFIDKVEKGSAQFVLVKVDYNAGVALKHLSSSSKKAKGGDVFEANGVTFGKKIVMSDFSEYLVSIDEGKPAYDGINFNVAPSKTDRLFGLIETWNQSKKLVITLNLKDFKNIMNWTKGANQEIPGKVNLFLVRAKKENLQEIGALKEDKRATVSWLVESEEAAETILNSYPDIEVLIENVSRVEGSLFSSNLGICS
ncbi:hypothetical protein DSO57_1012609 [Entomophthora muscae]|uniref:Uncharacterized protein n=1 Tax=Entomophthora muscae TaxID=34485 RepID=A0ACC2RKT7_9FUNG|nr:hypothetical protein DSO57_1012609 [Entomophthora muscae]